MKQEDKRFKQALGQDVPQWDDTPIWDEIEKTLPPKEEKRRFIWFFTGLSLLAVVVSIFFLLPETNVDKNTPTAALATDLNYKESATPSEKRINNKVKEIGSKTIQSNAPITQTQVLKLNPPSTSINKSARINIAEGASSEIKLQSQENTKSTSQLINRTTTAFNPKYDLKLPLLEFINTLPINKDPFQINERVFDELNQGKNQNIIPFKSKSNRSQLEFFGGTYYTTRKINSSNSDPNTFLDKTRPVETYDLGIKYTYELNSHWALSTGLTRRQTTEIFTSRDTLSVIDQVQTDTAKIVGLVPVAGVVNRTTSTPRTISNPNRLRQMLIPIQVTYKLPLTKMDLLISMGTDFRLSSSYSGYAIDGSGEVTTDDQIIGNLYKSSFTLNSINFSASSEFHLTNSLGLNIGVYMSYGLADHYSDDNIELIYNHYGARIGLVKKLR